MRTWNETVPEKREQRNLHSSTPFFQKMGVQNKFGHFLATLKLRSFTIKIRLFTVKVRSIFYGKKSLIITVKIRLLR